jgi:sortase A
MAMISMGGALIIASIVFSLAMFFYSFSVPMPQIAVQAIAPATRGVEEYLVALPERLVIPAIGIDAVVQHVGLDASGSGAMAVPSNVTDVGWYQPGIRPGMSGSAVIAGHLNGKTVEQAVFYDLEKLKVGDEVIVMSNDRIENIFHVVRIAVYDYDDVTTEVFESTDGTSRLNLITCAGTWMTDEKLYDKRTVVFTELLTDVD